MNQPTKPTRGEVRLPQGAPKPFIHPGVDQAALAFEAARKARQARNPLPKTNAPVAGGPPLQIPNLVGAPQQSGLTMAQYAAIERGAPAQPTVARNSFVESSSVGPNRIPSSPAQMGILPTDELPPQAKDDPAFVSGTGAMFAANQPMLAGKYGVVRGGRHIPPQQLAGAQPQQQQRQIRPETTRDLEELAALQRKQAQAAIPASEEATDMGKAAGEVGIPAVNNPLSDEDREELNEAFRNLDQFDFDKWRQSLMRDVLNNEQQKKIIESRLKPMDVGDLITRGYIIQRVDINPGRFWVEFKTLDGETDLSLKRLIMEDSRSVEVSDRYYLDKFGLMSVAAVVHKINDRAYGDITDENGNFHDERFRKKFNQLLKLPMPMLASLGANALWFDIRVRKLFVAEAVGNG